jgi:eukaryotic-like serine/threonine-protein kinase
MTLAAGTRLDSFEIVSPLGAGGMGEVYRARDTVLKRDVAIKVLPEYWSRDPERLHRFEQEAQAAAALNHPNIVSIFHVGQYNGSPYIVTELLHGETLRERLRHGPMRLREAIDAAGDVARGLAAAHDAGIVHRDLKPENIFITKDGRVKILDFGLAKLNPAKSARSDEPTESFQQQTSPGHVLGTVGYMSPEQVRGQPADARSDIFAAGAVLYEMLTGKPAFRKATSPETMTAVLNEDPPAVSQLAPNLPPGLQRTVNRCLSKSPEQRIQHATDLAFALEALSDSSSTGVASVKEQESSKRWLWVAGGVAAFAIAAAIFVWWKVPPAVPVIEAVTQLTEDGEPKQGALVSDGARIYFNEGQSKSWRIAQVSVSGGPTAPVSTKLVDPQLAALAPDGSALLAVPGGTDALTTGPLWSIPLPAGEPRRLGAIEAQWADFFPDGRIVFSNSKELFVADKNGSDTRKLFSPAGNAWNPAVSPDGTRIACATGSTSGYSLSEIAANGTDYRTLQQGVYFAQWSFDGRYLAYSVRHAGRSDLWVLPMQTDILHRSRAPIRLTNGPLSYGHPLPGRDGKQIFAIGTKPRGELVRYDMRTHQFVPFLAGISATDPTFSRDGQWVAYASYPDRTLWLSRSDGTERQQLTYPPLEVRYPFISPDGTKIAFTTSAGGIYVVSVDGRQSLKIDEKLSSGGTWSPDGNLLSVTSFTESPTHGGKPYVQILDLRTGKMSPLPSSQGIWGGMWVTQDELVALNEALTKIVIFDFKTQKWSDLASGNFVNWNVSPDQKYLYVTTGGAEPKAQRLRFADGQIETIMSLKDLRRVVDESTQIDVAPDGSPVFTRDIGSQEIYALTIKWP